MSKFTLKAAAFLLGFVLSLPASQADASCGGKPKISMSDGGVGCVIEKKLTTITSTQSILGAGPAASRKSTADGGVVVVKFTSEQTSAAVSRRKVRTRAKELCKRYRAEFLAEVPRPGNPFIAVVLLWGDLRGQFKLPSGGSKQIYLTKNCHVRSSR